MAIKITFFSRAVVFYCITAALVYVAVDKEKWEHGQKIRSHHYFQAQAYTALISFLEKDGSLEPEQWQQFIQYAAQLQDYMPQSVEAYHLQGVLDYAQGRKNRAVQSFRKAVNVNPDFFLSYYNLGLVLFEQKDYREAARVFKAAFSLNPQKTLQVLRSSKVLFQPVIQSAEGEKPLNLMLRIKEAYQEAYLMNILCYLKLKDARGLLHAAQAALSSQVGQTEVYGYYQQLAREQLGLAQAPQVPAKAGGWRPPPDLAAGFSVRLY